MMKTTHKEVIWALAGICVLIILLLVFTPVQAGVYHHVINNYYEETNITEFSSTGTTTSALDHAVASAMAADAISFTTSSRKRQFGFGIGYKHGANEFAAGFAQSFEIKGQPILFGIKGATDSSYGLGMNLTF